MTKAEISVPDSLAKQRARPGGSEKTPGTSAAMVYGTQSGYGRAFGVLALIAAILAVAIPVLGVLWFSPLAVILGLVALKGGARGFGIAVLVIVAVNMILSPTFWLNIGAGSQMPGASANRAVTYVNVFGVMAMILMLFRGRTSTAVAAVVLGATGLGLFGLLRAKAKSAPPSIASNAIQIPGSTSGQAPAVSEGLNAAPPAARQSGLDDSLLQYIRYDQSSTAAGVAARLAQGANVYAQDVSGLSALHMAVFYREDTAIVNLLVAKGADLNRRMHVETEGGLLTAPEWWMAQGAMRDFVLRAGADPSASDGDGDTMIFSKSVPKESDSFYTTDTSNARRLISHGINVNARNRRGQTALATLEDAYAAMRQRLTRVQQGKGRDLRGDLRQRIAEHEFLIQLLKQNGAVR